MKEYENDVLERMPQEELHALQLKLFNRQLQRAGRAPAYHGKLPEKIMNLSEIKTLPLTTKEDLRKNFPYGFLAVEKEKILRFNASSGTTGIPTLAYFTQSDIEYLTQRGVCHLKMAHLNSQNILQSMIVDDLFVGGWFPHNAALKMGITLLPAGKGNTKRQIDLLKQLKADAAVATCGYIQYLLNQLSDEDMAQINLKTVLIGSEPVSRAFCEVAREKYGIEIYESYGLTESGGPLAQECDCHNGLHMPEDQVYMEIIDPQTCEVLPDGEYGELVITPLEQEAMPLIRYRTRDITRIIPDTCRCGRTHRLIEPITHRLDDMLIVNGVNIFPSQIEECLYQHLPVATNYLIHVVDNNGLKKLIIDVELPDTLLQNKDELEEVLLQTLKGYITVTPKLNFVAIGTLPEVVGKAKRVDIIK